MSGGADAPRLATHYAPPNLAATLLEALRRAGKEPGALAPDDLAPVDQFHIRGKEATLELARLAGLASGMHVLRRAAAPPPLGLHLLLGADAGPMFENQARNLEEGRLAVIQTVFERA